jgi:hypothetical protein
MPQAAMNARVGAELAGVAIGPGHDNSSAEHGGIMGFEPNLAGPATTGPAGLALVLKVLGHFKTFCRTHHFRTARRLWGRACCSGVKPLADH